ncbi:hypothetical protein DES43_11260 [Aquamicrobium defluvii]|uniref:Uncharacterized protein n=1 Tax=Aquamicrobium defluvii TaxID=69279 RepID=A0A4R6YEZ7_9HYPH|nr:hypothetical protein DES43_11260 [Aquamicrobium defluvii]
MTLYAHTVEAFAPVTEPEYIAKKVRTELNRTGNAGRFNGHMRKS